MNEKSKIVFLEKFFMGTNWIKISKNLRIEEIQTPENTGIGTAVGRAINSSAATGVSSGT